MPQPVMNFDVLEILFVTKEGKFDEIASTDSLLKEMLFILIIFDLHNIYRHRNKLKREITRSF